MNSRQETAKDTVVEMLEVMDQIRDITDLDMAEMTHRRTLLKNISDDALLEVISRVYLIDEIKNLRDSSTLKHIWKALERISGKV